MSTSSNRNASESVEDDFTKSNEYELYKNQFKFFSAELYKIVKAINGMPIDQFEAKILGIIPHLLTSRAEVDKHLEHYGERVYLKPAQGSEKIWYHLYKRGLEVLKAGLQKEVEFEKPDDFFDYLLSQAGDGLVAGSKKDELKKQPWVLSYPPNTNKFVVDLHFLLQQSKAIFTIYDEDYELHKDDDEEEDNGAFTYPEVDGVESPEDLVCHFMHSILMLMKTSALMVDEGELKQKILINGFIKSLEEDVSGLEEKNKNDFLSTITGIADRVGLGNVFNRDRLKLMTENLGSITPDKLDEVAKNFNNNGFLNIEEMVDADGNINPQFLIDKIGEAQRGLSEMELPEEAKAHWGQNPKQN